MSYKVLDLPLEERPREKMLGGGSLTTAELIAILLGSGSPGDPVTSLAKSLLIRFGTLERLGDASVEELLETKGIGPAKAVKLLAALELAKRIGPSPRRTSVASPSEAYLAIKGVFDGAKEERIGVALLDTKGGVIRTEIVAIGAVNSARIAPRDCFHPAIRHKAARLILAHNHPSGDPAPSSADLSMTRAMIEAGRLLEIEVVDHLILGTGGYTALRDLHPELWKI